MHTVYTVFFYQLLNQRRPQRLSPSAFELPPCPAQRQSRPGRQPRLTGTPRGARAPRSGLERNSLHLRPSFVFPLQSHSPHGGADLGHPRRTPQGAFAARSTAGDSALARRKGRGRAARGTALSTQQSFFFSFQNKQKIYIYIFIFSCRVAPEEVCMASLCGPNLKVRTEACPPGAGAQQDSEGQSQGGLAGGHLLAPRAWLLCMGLQGNLLGPQPWPTTVMSAPPRRPPF